MCYSNPYVRVRKIVFVFFLIFAMIPACGRNRIDDAGTAESPYKNLKAKDDVLYNLLTSYELRDSSAYDRLLDPAFEFIFDWEDSANGQTPARWPRSSELQATGRIFVGSGAGTNLASCKNIGEANLRRVAGTMRWGPVKSYMRTSGDTAVSLDLLISYTKGDSAWAPVPALDNTVYGNETWYRKRISCSLYVQTSQGLIFTVERMPGEFFVRYAAAGGDSIWRIVQWYDYPLP